MTTEDTEPEDDDLAAVRARSAELEARLNDVRTRQEDLQARVADLEAMLGQLHSIAMHDRVYVPPPPKRLQMRTVGAYVPVYIESGFSICNDLNAALAPAGKGLGDFRRILDFGCGGGRTTRALKTRYPSVEAHGIDIDSEGIAWLAAHLGHLADFSVGPHQPPTQFPDGFFDFIFSVSVFTHLPEDMQFQWLDELRRITKPGGYLVLTTAGENHYRRQPEERRAIMETKGFCYADAGYGQSIALPAFYQNTWHSIEYIRREWSKYFDILDIQPMRVERDQDTTLLRRPE